MTVLVRLAVLSESTIRIRSNCRYFYEFYENFLDIAFAVNIMNYNAETVHDFYSHPFQLTHPHS